MRVLYWAVFCLCWLEALTLAMDVAEFFPLIRGNFTQVTWAHAVNSQKLMVDALGEDDIMMLEADVSMGDLVMDGKVELSDIPIMAHPPSNSSDLSLEHFLIGLIRKDTKGMKLDFKSVEVFLNSLGMLQRYKDRINFPMWLNADILPGPDESTATPVDADVFLEKCKADFPQVTLSVGWTTRYTSEARYVPEHTEAMRDVLERHGISQPVTFPVRASLATRSAPTLLALLDAVPNSTLTVWGAAADPEDREGVEQLVAAAGSHRVYLDLPSRSGGPGAPGALFGLVLVAAAGLSRI